MRVECEKICLNARDKSVPEYDRVVVRGATTIAGLATATESVGGRRVQNQAVLTEISGDPQTQNTRSDEPILPVTSTVRGIRPVFTRTFAPNSVTFLRIKIK